MKDKIIVFSFLAYLLFFSIAHVIFKDEVISNTERRKLKEFPNITFTSDDIVNIEAYLLDHFPYREHFRKVKAMYNYHVMQKLDNNGIYYEDDYIYKSNYPTNKKSVQYFLEHINKLSSMFNENNHVYTLVVPDKNYYLEGSNFLHLDYDYIYKEIKRLETNNIDIRNILNMSDYYKTDTHWRQENLDKVVKHLVDNMNLEYQSINYQKNCYDKFYGVYYGESALDAGADKLCYLTNDLLNNVLVNYLENPKLHTVYNINKLDSLDSYEVYLDGASSYIEIINNNCSNNKELVIFRDSFGSSITPLLIPYYSKITVIDNRYISSDNFLKYIEFNNQDILFIYSTLIVNNSFSLKN